MAKLDIGDDLAVTVRWLGLLALIAWLTWLAYIAWGR